MFVLFKETQVDSEMAVQARVPQGFNVFHCDIGNVLRLAEQEVKCLLVIQSYLVLLKAYEN